METIKHACVPATMTPEALGDWIMTQKVDQQNHVEKIPLTEDEITQFEHDSSLASRAIDKLMEVKKYFDNSLKKGTPYDKATESHKPLSITIPPTRGLDALKSNREHADAQIVKGCKEEITELYLIPFPEKSRMIMVNIVGVEWPDYSRDMTADEIQQYKPLLRVSKNETLADTAVIKKGKEDDLFPEQDETPVSDPDKGTTGLPFG